MKLNKNVFEPRLTLREACDYAELPLQNVYYHVNKGNIKSFVQHGIRYVLLSEIAKFISENKKD